MERERFPAVRSRGPESQACSLVLSLANLAFAWPRVGSRSVGKIAWICLTDLLPTQVGSHQDITEESFSLFWMLEPRIGMGEGES